MLEAENRMQAWQIPGVPRQQNFSMRWVKPQFQNPQIKRVFVIISDALRYEVAEELGIKSIPRNALPQNCDRSSACSQSYTQLGMAALLPHEQLCYQPGNGDIVYADGLSTSGIPNRDTILKNYKGMAIKSKDLLELKNQEGRDLIRDYEVVYIWHNTIDATGDTASTEDKTFEACRTAVTELKDLVTKVINRLHGTRILLRRITVSCSSNRRFRFRIKPLCKLSRKTLSRTTNALLSAISFPPMIFAGKEKWRIPQA